LCSLTLMISDDFYVLRIICPPRAKATVDQINRTRNQPREQMPFANLPTHEKDAFFALLDEYFASRPDLLSRAGGAAAIGSTQERMGTQPIPTAALTTAAQRALANPAATRMLASGIQRAATTGSRAGGGTGGHQGAASAAAMAPFAAAALPSLVSAASAHDAGGTKHDRNVSAPPPSTGAGVGFGRVAAAAQAFSGSGTASGHGTSASPAPAKPANPSKLVAQKKFGDVDVSSAGAMFRSLRGSTAAKNAPPPTVYTPPAFPVKKSAGLPPPPVRRASAVPAAPSPEPEEDVQAEPEQEEGAGEWAEALYDYTSEEASDLHLREGERVLVTEKTSSDWWTGEVDGRSGLFPVSYVKLL